MMGSVDCVFTDEFVKQTHLSSCFAFLSYTNVLYIVSALLPLWFNRVKIKLTKPLLIAAPMHMLTQSGPTMAVLSEMIPVRSAPPFVQRDAGSSKGLWLLPFASLGGSLC